MESSVRGLGISKFWKGLCEESAAPVAQTWPGQSACWERMKQESCYAGDGKLSWRQAQENLARRSLAPFPEIVPIHPLRRPELCQHASLGAFADDAGAEETKQANAWLKSTVAVYVLVFSEQQDTPGGRAGAGLASQGVDFTPLRGLDLALNGSYQRAKQAGAIPGGFDFSRAEEASQSKLQGMDGIAGAVGLAASHLQAMDHAASAGDERPLVLVLEEDAAPAEHFAVKLRRLVQDEVPCDWVAVSLQSACPYGECVAPHLARVRPNTNEPAERCHHGANFGFYSMLYRKVTLPPLVRRLRRTVWDEKRPRCLDVDVALSSLANELAYYAVPKVQVPGLIVSGGGASSRRKNVANAQVQLEEPDKQGISGNDNHKKSKVDEDDTPLFYYTTTTTTSTSQTSTTTSLSTSSTSTTSITSTTSTTLTVSTTTTSTTDKEWWKVFR